MMKKKRLAVRLAAPTAIAVAAIAIPSLSGTAQAGAICAVVSDGTPLYAEDSVEAKVLGTMDAGEEVAATGPFDLWQVSRADNGEFLGYMRQADVSCSGG
ncbi:hypothetical protein GCM10012287_05990 [Streptomyces daqingensis]|jgi:hypothetical protein|uniref:SH3 domain-containing protein n=2 Tax=Streptomyces daqingensis TaxID=1472640 RepID=A0ABQ2LUN3_9ACTN|nr:hypothetical protein GCM10012287_05990 [Streptomyces daqingensis]